MKKGFTLVEVVAVIIILAVIGLIALPAINSSIEESRKKSYDSQVEIIIESSKRWSRYNNDLLPNDNSVYKLTLTELINGKYVSNIEDGKLKNPKDPKSYMNGCVYISFNETYNQYIYEYKDEC